MSEMTQIHNSQKMKIRSVQAANIILKKTIEKHVFLRESNVGLHTATVFVMIVILCLALPK
jgi:hypothetical protein